MNPFTDFLSNCGAIVKLGFSPFWKNRQALFFLLGVALIVTAIVFSILTVSAASKVRDQTVSSFNLSTPPLQSEAADAESAKKEAIKTAILLGLGFLSLLCGFPFAAGVFIASAG
jgi:hypothetical protein